MSGVSVIAFGSYLPGAPIAVEQLEIDGDADSKGIAPLLTPETAQAIGPYVPLAEMLGRFFAQFFRTESVYTLQRLPDPDNGVLYRGEREPHVGARLNELFWHAIVGPKERRRPVAERAGNQRKRPCAT